MIYFEGKYLGSKYTFWTKFSPGLSLVLDSFETLRGMTIVLKKTLSLFRKWCPVIYWVQCESKPRLGSWSRSWCLPSQGHGSTSVPSQGTPRSLPQPAAEPLPALQKTAGLFWDCTQILPILCPVSVSHWEGNPKAGGLSRRLAGTPRCSHHSARATQQLLPLSGVSQNFSLNGNHICQKAPLHFTYSISRVPIGFSITEPGLITPQ